MNGQSEDRKEGILSKVIGICILLAGAAGVFYAAYKVSYVSVDYGIHVNIARELDWSDPVRMLREHPEPVWHILVHALMNVTGFSAEKAAGLVSGGLCALTCLLAAHFLYHPVELRSRRRKKGAAVSGVSVRIPDGSEEAGGAPAACAEPATDPAVSGEAAGTPAACAGPATDPAVSGKAGGASADSAQSAGDPSDFAGAPGGPEGAVAADGSLTASAGTDGISLSSPQNTPDIPEKKKRTAVVGKGRGARTGRITVLGAALAAVALSFVSAIYVPWFNSKPYLGQGSPNPWHNPTTLMVRPIGFLIVMIVMGECLRVKRGGFRKKNGLRLWKGILIAVLLLLSNLSKPSFVQIFYPAIFLLMFFWLFTYHGRNFPLGMQLLVCCLPSCALMGAQFISAFYSGSNSDAAGVVFAPFKVAGLYTDNIAVSTLLVMAFPLLVCLFSIFRRTFGWTDYFAWVMLLVGMAEKFLLAESGSRMTHGNFSWGYILGLYFIWFSGIRLYTMWAHSLDEGAGGVKKTVSITAFALCGAVLFLHLLSGAYYLYYLIVLGHGI